MDHTQPAPALPDPASPVPSGPRCGLSLESRRFVLVAAILASSMGFIDGSVVSLAMPAIRGDLGASLAQGQWIHNAYMLTLSALVLIGGAAGDVFGVRNIFVAGIAIFVATSLACAVAPGADTLIAMRALQGIGAAIMVPGSLAIIAKSYPSGERGRAIGIWAASSSLTTAFGPFIGGIVLAFGADWMWRMIFAINLPIGLIALFLLLRRAPSDRPAGRRRIDWIGAVLATAAMGAVAWGLTAFGVAPEYRLVHPVAWLAGGAALLWAFVRWERAAADPMIKLDLFRSKAFTGANIYTFVIFFAFNAMLFFLPMTLIAAWSASEWQVSLLLLPVSVFIGLLSGPAGRFADNYGPRLPLTVGALLCAASHAGVAATMPMMDLWGVTLPMAALGGLGMALLVSPLSTAVMTAAPDADSGLASGVNNALARAAGLFAVAALGAVASVAYAAAIGDAASGAQFGVVPGTGGVPADRLAGIAASNVAFQWIAGLSAAISLVAAAIAWRTQPSWRSN